MGQDFKNRLVLIAGGIGDIGLAVSLRFLSQGADVVATYVSEAQVGTLRAHRPKESKKIFLVHLDALEYDRVQSAVADLVARKGVPDVLVNLVGAYAVSQDVAVTEPFHFHRMFDINFYSVFNMCRSILPHMLKVGRGKIVNVGARAGLKGSANRSAFSLSKAAVIRFTESLSAEVKDQGINVNCVLPSIINTENNRQDDPEADFTRWVSPEELADVIGFLASEESRAIHGAAIPVYGKL